MKVCAPFDVQEADGQLPAPYLEFNNIGVAPINNVGVAPAATWVFCTFFLPKLPYMRLIRVFWVPASTTNRNKTNRANG